jgi:hypothetical protein
MICIMHMSPRYGYMLKADRTAFTIGQLAALNHMDEAECTLYVSELEFGAVFSRTPDGVIYCRKMLRDFKERCDWRKRHQKHRDTDNHKPVMSRECHVDVTPSPSPIPSPSLIQLQKKEKSTTAQAPLPEWCPLDAWNDFRLMRQKIRKPMTGRAEQLVLQKLDALRQLGQNPREVLEQSICNSWQGIFPLKVDENGNGNSASKTSQQAERVAAMLSANRS